MSNPIASLTFCVVAFGCQMNKHDAERVSGLLESCGMVRVESIEESDVTIFLTCCVRESAETRLYGNVESIKNYPLRKGSPLDRRIVALGGCIGERDSEKVFERLGNVSVAFGTDAIAGLPNALELAVEHGGNHVADPDPDAFSAELPSDPETRFQRWLPITRGCDNFCTYCIVPYVRGREKSRKLQDIAKDASDMVAAGVKEITLLGQNVNSYGRDLYGKPAFAEVLRAVSDSGIDRIRFATSHPKDLTSEVIGLFATLPNLMPALHLPVQSGSNRILEAMNRRYSREHYLGLVDQLKSTCPELALSTDIIVGFPGETDQDFQDTMELVRQARYSQAFTFIYSPRSGTPAANLPDRVDRDVSLKRLDELVQTIADIAHEENEHELGKTVEVLIEGHSKKDPSMLAGKSPKNQTVHAPYPAGADPEALVGKYASVDVEDTRTWHLSGAVKEIHD